LKKYQDEVSSYENYFRAVNDRVENHTCITSCTVKEIIGNQVVLSCSENIARFREGDKVVLNPLDYHDEKLPSGYEMDWLSFDNKYNLIILEKSFNTRNKDFPFTITEKINIDQMSNDLHMSITNQTL